MAKNAGQFGTLLFVALLFARDGVAAGASYCEAFSYRGRETVLAIPREYYARPRNADSMISLMVRYKDLTAPSRLDDGYDFDELADPAWTLDHSNYTALIQIHRHDIQPSSTFEEFAPSYPNLKEVETDWPGWTRFEECRVGCQQVFYVSDTWKEAGVSYVLCYEVEGRNPLALGCGAYDYFEGLHTVFYFPAAKKAHFAEFRDRLILFVRKLVAEGAKNCTAN